jgi:hypothetical protein
MEMPMPMPNDSPVKLQLFEAVHIRSAWDESDEKWWLSALDVVAALTDQADYTKARNYRKWLKSKLKLEGSEVVSSANQLNSVIMEALTGDKLSLGRHTLGRRPCPKL